MKKHSSKKRAAAPVQDEQEDWEIEKPSPKCRPASLSENPVVAEIQKALRKADVRVSIQPRSSTLDESDRFIDAVFGMEAVQALGKMLIRALMDGDKVFAKTVEKAIKQIDPVFNRNRSIGLAKKVTTYVWSLPEPLPATSELKRMVEKHCNNGKELEAHDWLRLRKVCLIPIPSRGGSKKTRKR